jgi:bifunctional UDP-N-acetylglucosamine pyrophosphorylase/glucosamine-1-phosphate N-acetyltransferase
MRKLTLLILAAGKGTRLKSTLPKVLHQLAGKSLIEHVVEAAGPLNPSATCVVVGYEAARVESTLSDRSFQFAVQKPQLGTGHAVQVAGAFWKFNEGDLSALSRTKTRRMKSAASPKSTQGSIVLSLLI